MPKTILVPVDGSSQSLDALSFAVTEWPDDALLLLTVIDPVEAGYSTRSLGGSGEEWYERAKETAETTLDAARDAVGRDLSGLIEVGRPAKTIVDVAEERGVDHVVVGSHGRTGVTRIVLGSVAEHVARHAPVPVTIVR